MTLARDDMYEWTKWMDKESILNSEWAIATQLDKKSIHLSGHTPSEGGCTVTTSLDAFTIEEFPARPLNCSQTKITATISTQRPPAHISSGI